MIENLRSLFETERQRRLTFPFYTEIVGLEIANEISDMDARDGAQLDTLFEALEEWSQKSNQIMSKVVILETDYSATMERLKGVSNQMARESTTDKFHQELMLNVKELQKFMTPMSEFRNPARDNLVEYRKQAAKTWAKIKHVFLQDRIKQFKLSSEGMLFRGVNPDLARVFAGYIGMERGIEQDPTSGRFFPKDPFHPSDPFASIAEPGYGAEVAEGSDEESDHDEFEDQLDEIQNSRNAKKEELSQKIASIQADASLSNEDRQVQLKLAQDAIVHVDQTSDESIAQVLLRKERKLKSDQENELKSLMDEADRLGEKMAAENDDQLKGQLDGLIKKKQQRLQEIAQKRAREAAVKHQHSQKADIEAERFLMQMIQEGGPMAITSRRRESVQALMQEFEVNPSDIAGLESKDEQTRQNQLYKLKRRKKIRNDKANEKDAQELAAALKQQEMVQRYLDQAEVNEEKDIVKQLADLEARLDAETKKDKKLALELAIAKARVRREQLKVADRERKHSKMAHTCDAQSAVVTMRQSEFDDCFQLINRFVFPSVCRLLFILVGV